MEPFRAFTGVVAPLDRASVDTDAIIPKQFLKAVTREGLGPFLFDNWRYEDEGELGQDCARRPQNPDFVLNRPRYADAAVLLARENFGCGSSREHAVWALMDAGFRTVIAPSFADIFFANAYKNGLLCIALDEAEVDRLFRAVDEREGYALHVDLAAQALTTPDGERIGFDIQPSIKTRLLEGLDDIALSLQRADAIRAYEARRAREAPWLFPDRVDAGGGEP
ncbi:isopropylmalate isomerase small subunit [Salinisphaera sp. PC39]|uniref:3-isopropylmalate dehydratase small subunit n=1 Tax=Salinisphaera sp. PC39 TaxID=1304156 RepID=UPI00333FC87F